MEGFSINMATGKVTSTSGTVQDIGAIISVDGAFYDLEPGANVITYTWTKSSSATYYFGIQHSWNDAFASF